MAKAKTFADKVAKRGQIFGKVCPVCKEEIRHVMRVEPVKKGSAAIGFGERIVPYCKCNLRQAIEG